MKIKKTAAEKHSSMCLVRSAPKPQASFLLVAKETKAKKTTPLRNFSNRLLGRMFFGLALYLPWPSGAILSFPSGGIYSLLSFAIV
jgi:hypothetical protein